MATEIKPAFSFSCDVSEEFIRQMERASKPVKVYFVRQSNLLSWAKNLCVVNRLRKTKFTPAK
jgi:hypothetical protein